MRNKIFLMMLAALAVQGAGAKVRTTKQLIGEAARVITASQATMKAPSTNNNPGSLKVLKRDSQISIVGYEGGRCVVLANDDNFKPVLGYFDSSADGATAPAFEWWLGAVNESLTQMQENLVQPYDADFKSGLKSEVAPLLTTEWGQSAPYNNLCPTYGVYNAHYVTGCVATAMAQVLNYYEYPVKGNGSASWTFYPNGKDQAGVDTRVTFNTTYDWANMLDSYSKGYNSVQGNAVAVLMRDCGAAAQMNYAPSGSGSNNANAVAGMRSNLGFDETTLTVWRDYTPKDLWAKWIYKEISEGRPVMFGGSTKSGYGHEFVFDGYDQDGLVHVNWGWDGSDQGYFDMFLLNSSQGSYTEGQNALFTRVPGTTNEKFHSMWVTPTGFSFNVSGTSLTMSNGSLFNIENKTFVGTMGLVCKNLSTGKVFVPSAYKLPQIVQFAGYKDQAFEFNLKSLPDGKYQVWMGTHHESTSDDDYLVEDGYYPIYGKENVNTNFIVTKVNGTLTITPGNSDWTVTAISNVTVAGKTQPSGTSVYDIQGNEIVNTKSTFDINSLPANNTYIVKENGVTKKIVK